MAEMVDLSMETDDDPVDHEAQRRSIMSMAATANGSNGRGAGGTVGFKAPRSPLHKRQRVAKDSDPPLNGTLTSLGATAAASPAPAPAIQPMPIVSVSQAIPLSPGNVLLASLHAERCLRQRAAEQARQAQPSSAVAPPSTSMRLEFEGRRVEARAEEPPAEISFLTYNVWFEESIALQERMAAIGRIIEEAGCPDVLMFQEVTHNIAALWRQSSWWRHYAASPVSPAMPYFTMLCTKKATLQLSREGFVNRQYGVSVMGRGLLSATCTFRGRPLRVATTHLESPLPGNQNEGPRSQQIAEAMGQLVGDVDTVFAGDMNWTSKTALPLPRGWRDAWLELQPGDKGYTYDGAANPMLGNRWQSRMDRMLVSLRNFQPVSISMVGCDKLPGVMTTHKKGRTLPVLPSDHFGLLMRLRTASAASGASIGGRH